MTQRVLAGVCLLLLGSPLASDRACAQPFPDPGDPLPAGALQRLGTPRLRHSGPVADVAYAPDGKTLASGGSDGAVRVWAVGSGQELATLRHGANPVSAVAYSPDGRWLAACASKQIVVWTCATLEVHRVAKGDPTILTNALTLAFAPDSSWLAVGWQHGAILRWSMPEMTPLPPLAECPPSVSGLAVSPDGRWLAAGGYGPAVHVWDLKSGGLHWRHEVADAYMVAVAFSPDGTRLAIGGAQTDVTVWDVASRTQKQDLRFDLLTGRCLGLAYSRDGRFLAGGVDRAVIVWDAAGRELRRLGTGGGPVYAVAFAPDGSALAAGSSDHAVRMWSLPGGAPLPASLAAGHYGCVTAVVPLGSDRLASASQDPTVRIWDLPTARTIRRLEDTEGTPDQSLLSHSMAVTADGRTLAASSRFRTTLAWGLEHERAPLAIPAFNDRPRALAYSPDGRMLAAACHEGRVEVWDPANGVRGWPAHEHGALAVVWSPDGTGVVSAGGDASVVRWPATGASPSGAFGSCGRSSERGRWRSRRTARASPRVPSSICSWCSWRRERRSPRSRPPPTPSPGRPRAVAWRRYPRVGRCESGRSRTMPTAGRSPSLPRSIGSSSASALHRGKPARPRRWTSSSSARRLSRSSGRPP